MPPFLLIHGSCHGAWCWRDILPFLNKTGQAKAIDLPGHGDDKTPLSQVTLDLYVEAILDAITTPVVLVGHSMAGFPIAAAAERAPEKIAQLIFVCAYAPRNGLSLVEMRKAYPEQPLRQAIATAPDALSFSFRPEQVLEKLYHDCPEGTLEYALPRLTPQPIMPQATPITLGQNYANTAKRYIQCSNDRAIPPAYQARMAQGWPDRAALTCAHSPFFAKPAELAKALL